MACIVRIYQYHLRLLKRGPRLADHRSLAVGEGSYADGSGVEEMVYGEPPASINVALRHKGQKERCGVVAKQAQLLGFS
jgi:hypothetical protein